MQQRQLGQTGPQIGAIGLGCMSFGGFYGPTTEAESHATLDAALDFGITHLDTANIYGNGISESVIGSYIAKNGNKFVIATKAGIDSGPPRRFNNEREYLNTCLEASMKRLNVDYVDLFYVHRREQERPIEEVTETLVEMKNAGKIGGFGFSEISPASLSRALAVHPVMAVQNEYSLWSRLPDLGIIQACEKHDISLVAYSPLARGMLADVVPQIADFEDNDHRKSQPRFTEPNYSFNVAAIDKFRQYAHDHGWSTAALALAWILHRSARMIPIPGTRSADHLRQLATAGDIKLNDRQMAEIEEILPVGFAHGDRYSPAQYVGPERYC